jgi:hypothetical protein
VFLELTRREKVARIAAVGCSHFIDDLPELFAEEDFPEATRRILFDPNDRHVEQTSSLRLSSWEAIERVFLSGGANGD